MSALPTLARMGLWFGLVYGLLEGLEVQLLRLIPGVLSWRTGNSAQVLWVAPLVYAAAFVFIAVLIWVLSRLWRRLPADVLLVALTMWTGAFLALTLPGLVLSDLAAGVLALGVATEGARQFRRRRDAAHALIRRTVAPIALAVGSLALLITAGGAVAERWRMSRLAAVNGRPPNVLLLVLDTQRADHLSSYGYRRQTSPRLDQFATEGTRYAGAYSNSSWTLPSHATMMTGQLPDAHRAGIMRRPYLDNRFPTVAEALRSSGYATGGFVSNTFWCGRQTGLARGFIRYEDFYGNAGDALARTVIGRRLAYEVLPRYGFIDVPGRKYASEINSDLLRWIDGLDGKPFFAFANYFDVHGPYLPRDPFAGRFGAPRRQERSDKIEIGALTGEITVPPPEQLAAMVASYDESLLYLDDQLGKLFDELRRRGILDQTLVIITSDHGESWGEHGMMFHGHSLYHEQIHVPLIVRYPTVVAAGVSDTRAVGLERLPATIASITGLARGAFPGPSLLEAGEATETAVVAQVARRSSVPAGWPTSRGSVSSLVTDRWQLIVSEGGSVELYDVQSDPAQANNLAASPASRDLLTHLRAELERRSEPSGAATITRR